MGVRTKSEETKDQVIDDMSEKPKSRSKSKTKEKKSDLDLDKLKALKAKMKSAIKEPKKPKKDVRSINFGIVGSGQAGSALSACFSSLGYDAVAINTALQDLEYIDIPKDNKLHLEYGLGGAGKDMTIGHEAAQAYKEAIYDLVDEKLSDCHMFVFCTSLGGGSGSGSAETIIDILHTFAKPIIVITVLPMTNEDVQTKSNALHSLSVLSKKVQEKIIHNLIVVDNAKIEAIFSDVSQMDFYNVGNKAIVEPLHIFNTYSSMPSPIKALDPTDFSKILIDGEGLSLYGCMSVYDYQEDTAIAEAIVTNLTSGLLASGFDLGKTKYVGAMVLASEATWKKIPSSSINYAMEIVQDTAGMPLGVFKGIYESDNMEDDVVKVYSFFSGLALPDVRIKELKKEVAKHKSIIVTKDKDRNLNLEMNKDESEAVSAAEQIRQKIKKNKSIFGQFNKGVVDKRKGR